jgi:pyruvate,water dikinase
VTDIDIDQPFVIDRVPSKRFPVYTRANVAEVFPGPATPLVFSTTAGMLFDLAWREALMRFGAFDPDEFDPDKEEMLGIFYGYPYLNLSVQRVFGVRMPGASPAAIDASFFGTTEGVPPHEPNPRDESPRLTERITQKIGEILSAPGIPRLDDDRRKTEELRANRPDFATLTATQLWEHADPLISTWFAELEVEHLYIISASAIPIGIVVAAAAALGDAGLAMRALSGLGGVDSATPTYDMWDLSRLIEQSAPLTDAFDAGVPGVLDRLRNSPDPAAIEFLRRFDHFVYEHGSRGPNEMDPGDRVWETEPELALTAIDRMRLQPASASPREGNERLAADREKVIVHMLEQVAGDPEAHGQLQAALRAAAVWLPARERSKLNTVRLVHEARLALFELGRRMVEAQVFDAPNDFVMLSRHEFPAFLSDPASWSGEIRHRRAWFAQLAELEPPFTTVGVPLPPSTWRRRTVTHLPPVSVGEVITGIAVCPGAATGTARVIMDPAEGGDLEPGDVLVAPHTDPAWTPLFVSAAAIVVDIGAPLSHAAIVSRELGVPCVVSATNASRRIPNGARITVDGTAGTVTIDALPPA